MINCSYTLYLVTDRALAGGRATADIIREAIAGGVTCVQLREKDCSTRQFIAEARLAQAVTRAAGIPLIINDRLDVAQAIGADGLHLGQQDMAIADARRLVGTTMIIGISVESIEDAVQAEQAGADYLGVSPVFVTTTKKDAAPPLGLAGLRQIRQAVRLPLVAIGGIHVDNAAEVIAAGADGLAVVSAIVAAPCPRSAAAALGRQITAARQKESR